MTVRQEMRDTVARALCCHRDQPCAFCTSEAGLAVAALVLGGHLQTGGGAVVPGGGSPPSAGAVNTAPSSPNRSARYVIAGAMSDRNEQLSGEASPLDFDGARMVLAALDTHGLTVTQSGGGAGDTPPAASAATPGPAAQADQAIGSPTPSPPFPRRFRLYRHEDPSGVSGTKWVAEGIQFIDGYTALRWFGEHPCTVPWDSIDRIIAVHGHGGLTEIVWLDGS